MPLTQAQRLDILNRHPSYLAVFEVAGPEDPAIKILVDRDHLPPPEHMPAHLHGLPVRFQKIPRITTLPLWLHQLTDDAHNTPSADHRRCHDEPIPAGVQIQPKGAPWVGTLGCCCRFLYPNQRQRWGILSNWHVITYGSPPRNRPQHQPRDTFPPIAHLSDWQPVNPNQVNYFDAAVADSNIGDHHTTGRELLGLGPLAGPPARAHVGLNVAKSGRTTGVTHGQCIGINAAVKVQYPNFVATFDQQDVYAGDPADFSAAGDSGSLIITGDPPQPVALLFAGGGDLTIGSPIDFIAEHFGAHFNFPQGGAP